MRKILAALLALGFASPVWAQNTNAPVPVPRGGTGLILFQPHQLYVGNGTGALVPVSPGTVGQALLSGGSGADPAFADPIVTGGGPVSPNTAQTGSLLTGCIYRSGTITMTNLQQAASACDASGNVIVSGLGSPADAASPYSGTGNGNLIQIASGILATAKLPLATQSGSVSIGGVNVLNTPLSVTCSSGCSGVSPVAPASSDAVASKVLKNSSGTLYSFEAVNYSSTSGFLIAYNATAAPSAGALTSSLVLGCSPLPTNNLGNFAYSTPATFSAGIVILVSSGANCTTYNNSTITAYISGQAS